MRWTVAAAGLVAIAALGCADAPRATPSSADAGAPPTDPLASLRAFEAARRRDTDFARAPASDHSFGPDPIALQGLPRSSPRRYVGLLRGRDALVLLDEALHEIARTDAPALPTGLAVGEDGTIAVSGEQSPAIGLYRVKDDALRAQGRVVVDPSAYGLRAVAIGRAHGERVLYAVDERRGTLAARAGQRASRVVHPCAGPFRVVVAGTSVLVDCLLDHRVLVFDTDPEGLPIDSPRAVIQHDGPMWGLDARVTDAGLVVAIGGVEDHPLDRTEGSFGFIDSFVFVYRVPRESAAISTGAPQRLFAVNVSEHGVITPKAIALRVEPDGGATVFAAGYGSDRIARIAMPAGGGAPSVTTFAGLPGVAGMVLDGARLAMANPLFDAWAMATEEGTTEPVGVPDAASATPRSPWSRVGEALFFTNLMSPWNRSDGRLSRFTCETCHFEGYVDGRTHHTGRGDVRATTKPLLGIFNNRPHFSRALDPDLTTMVDNEFRAAGAKSDHDPWFSAEEAAMPWAARLGVPLGELDALGLRRALMTFFMDFTHRPNTSALRASRVFDATERRGAAVFASTCERCHQARLSTDDASTRRPLAAWEALVLGREGPLVWASEGYYATGVKPYVHELGARPPSLRRLYKKLPYFTNGSAKSLDDVLARARWRGDTFWHDGGPPDATRLALEERVALAAFLDLL